jgi:nucleotide-binding universal stress UspA family protein
VTTVPDAHATASVIATNTEASRPVADSSAPQFRRAVIALSGGRTDRSIVALASEQARPDHAELIGVHVVEIDWTLPLDADVAGRSEDAQRVLDIAEATAEAHRYKLDTVLLQARDVGAAIVDEATERDADLIICGLPFRRRFGGDFAIGATIPYILKNAPCAVWVIREAMPEEQP